MTDEILQTLLDLNGDPYASHLWMQRHVQNVDRPTMCNVKLEDD